MEQVPAAQEGLLPDGSHTVRDADFRKLAAGQECPGSDETNTGWEEYFRQTEQLISQACEKARAGGVELRELHELLDLLYEE